MSNQGPAAQGSDSEAVRVLRAARNRVARGWCQHLSFDRHGNVCADGGMYYGAMDIGLIGAYSDATDYFAAIVGARSVPWNDTPGRTQAEVLAAFDKAIALAEWNARVSAPSASASDSLSEGRKGDDP